MDAEHAPAIQGDIAGALRVFGDGGGTAQDLGTREPRAAARDAHQPGPADAPDDAAGPGLQPARHRALLRGRPDGEPPAGEAHQVAGLGGDPHRARVVQRQVDEPVVGHVRHAALPEDLERPAVEAGEPV